MMCNKTFFLWELGNVMVIFFMLVLAKTYVHFKSQTKDQQLMLPSTFTFKMFPSPKSQVVLVVVEN